MWAHSEGNTERTLQVDEIKILVFLLALPVSLIFKGYSHGASWSSDALKLVMLWSCWCPGTGDALGPVFF